MVFQPAHGVNAIVLFCFLFVLLLAKSGNCLLFWHPFGILHRAGQTAISMKIGIHQHVFTKNLLDGNLDLMNVVRDYGFDSMDINVRVLDLAGARLIRKRAEALGLHLMG
jgi:hypothetical protein